MKKFCTRKLALKIPIQKIEKSWYWLKNLGWKTVWKSSDWKIG